MKSDVINYYFDRKSDLIRKYVDEVWYPTYINNLIDFIRDVLLRALHSNNNIDLIECINNVSNVSKLEKNKYKFGLLSIVESERKYYLNEINEYRRITKKRN